MKVGDLVRYRKLEFVTERVHEDLIGLVLQISVCTDPETSSAPVYVKWNTQHSEFMWHPSFNLKVIHES